MKWLVKWRSKQGAKSFRKRSAMVKFPHAFIDLELATRIGFIVNIEGLDADELLYVTKYVNSLKMKGKEVLVVELNFQPKAQPLFRGKIHSLFLGKAHRNWLGLPALKKMHELNKANLEILVNLDRSGQPTATYICGLSNAATRVGIHTPDFEEYFELMLQLPAETKIPKVLEHFEHYSNMLHK